MQEVSITYFVVAWLACWLIDLIIIIARGPLTIDPVLKFIVVLLCLSIVLYRLAHHGWLLGG
jgi:hypothetical protein